MTIKVGNQAVRMISSANRHAKPLATSGLSGWGEHKHVWKQKRGDERICKKCGMRQQKLAGMWM
jgi:hypothetical protein